MLKTLFDGEEYNSQKQITIRSNFDGKIKRHTASQTHTLAKVICDEGSSLYLHYIMLVDLAKPEDISSEDDFEA